MELTLKVAKGKTAMKEIAVSGKRILIGRRTGCQIQIPSPLVSREHCVLTEDAGKIVLQDLGSSNGTFVNGAKVRQKHVKAGDTIGVGPLTFVLRLAKAAGPGDTARPQGAAAVGAEPAPEEAAADEFEVAEVVDEASDFVVAEPEPEADTVHNLDVSELAKARLAPKPAAPKQDDIVVAELVEAESESAEADFVVAEPDAEPDFVVAEPEAEAGFIVAEQGASVVAESAPQPVSAEPQPEPKKSRFGWFARKGNQAEPKAATPTATPAAAAPVADVAVADVADGEFPTFEAAAPGSAPANDDELADFLTGLNEKDGK